MRIKTAVLTSIAVVSLGSGLVGCGPEYPNCDNDDDCHEGEYCVNGLCQQCRTDADCPTGERCVGGRCEAIEGFCQSADDCPDGQECRNNRCAEPEMTTTDTDLGAGGDQGCSIEPVYFAYDSSSLRGDARSQIQSNVDCMKEKGVGSVHLTGYTDPRGTEEYNLALGDRRARSVRDYVSDLGFDGELSVSSMGEEMARGTDEESWARDRRVEFDTTR